jgi:hypothetical protein
VERHRRPTSDHVPGIDAGGEGRGHVSDGSRLGLFSFLLLGVGGGIVLAGQVGRSGSGAGGSRGGVDVDSRFWLERQVLKRLLMIL